MASCYATRVCPKQPLSNWHAWQFISKVPLECLRLPHNQPLSLEHETLSARGGMLANRPSLPPSICPSSRLIISYLLSTSLLAQLSKSMIRKVSYLDSSAFGDRHLPHAVLVVVVRFRVAGRQDGAVTGAQHTAAGNWEEERRSFYKNTVGMKLLLQVRCIFFWGGGDSLPIQVGKLSFHCARLSGTLSQRMAVEPCKM